MSMAGTGFQLVVLFQTMLERIIYQKQLQKTNPRISDKFQSEQMVAGGNFKSYRKGKIYDVPHL